MQWVDGAVSAEDSVLAAEPVSGRLLRDTFLAEMPAITLGLVRARNESLWLGPIELIRFGRPKITDAAVEWPIEGGLMVGSPGGRWRIGDSGGRLGASLHGNLPLVSPPIHAWPEPP